MKETTYDFRMTCIIGLLLFSMFFGSGNLIFPPFLGLQAAGNTLSALLGFGVTAVVFPVLGVIAIARNKDLITLSSHVNWRFAMIFPIIVFLSLGPGLAIPRNAAVSFEMAVVPFAGNVSLAIRIAYSIVFFLISWLLSVHPEKLVDWLGKILGPILLGLMIVLCLYCIANVHGASTQAQAAYAVSPLVQGFLDGYNTMDTLAALNFGNLIAMNIMAKGIREKKQVVGCTIRAGWIAGLLLFLVYAALSFAGKACAGLAGDVSNGANVLTWLVSHVLGLPGVILLAVIYVLSCLTTCVGLLCSCAEFFTDITKASYRFWITLFCIAGCAFSVAGLNGLLKISVPFLTAIYPIAMVLVILGLFQERLKRYPHVFATAVSATGIASMIYALNTAGIVIPCVTPFLLSLYPCADLCWLIPSILGFLAGMIPSVLHAGQESDRIPA